jgi:hypothetical protein
MSYSSKEIWIPTSKQAELIEQNTSSDDPVPVKAGGDDANDAIPRGLCYGYHIKVSAAQATNSAIPIKLFDADGGDELYSTTVDLSSLTQTVDILATPIPFFDTPYFVIGPTGSSAGTLTYTIRFLFKALA